MTPIGHRAMRAATGAGIVALVSACAGPKPAALVPADLVLENGRIVTMDPANPVVEALAAKGETLLALGTNASVRAHASAATRVIDLRGRLAVPGLIEGHGHFLSFGASLMELDLRHAHTWDEIVEQVGEAAAKARPGDWIVGRGWHQEKWDSRPARSFEGFPTHFTLSAKSPRNPVFLSHTSGHGVFVNARALELASITRDTRNPAGGEIVRDREGQPTGMLREAAAEPARRALAKWQADRPAEAIERERREHVRLASKAALAHGITSFQDMGASFEEIDLIRKVADEGGLEIRLYLSVEETAAVMKEQLARYRMVGHAQGYLTVRTIGEKVLDGALGTHGGWLLEPYADLPRSLGLNVTPVEEIRRSAELAIAHDYQMAIQGIGDRAVRVLLDLYAEAAKSRPDRKDLRWRIEHAQVIHPDDLPRFAREGVIPSVQGIFACSDGPWVVSRLGEARTRERGYLFLTLMRSGAVVTNGTDPPVDEIDPVASFDCSVTRRLPDGSFFAAEQRLSREQALRSYTANNAYAAFEESVKGTLSPGRLADVTVLSKDLLSVPDDQIRTSTVDYTIVGGRVRYESRRGTANRR